jgi:hypothetical protein
VWSVSFWWSSDISKFEKHQSRAENAAAQQDISYLGCPQTSSELLPSRSRFAKIHQVPKPSTFPFTDWIALMTAQSGGHLAILERRRRVADLYIQGWTQMEIAAKEGCTQATISADLIQIRREWRASTIRDFDEARTLELQKLDRVEREAWRAWERSQQPQQSAHISDEPNARHTKRHVKNQNGDPRFLEQVNKCIAMRCALLGLNMQRIGDGDDGFTFDDRRDRIVAIACAIRDRQGAAAAGARPGRNEPGRLCSDSLGRTVDAGPAPGVSGSGDSGVN